MVRVDLAHAILAQGDRAETRPAAVARTRARRRRAIAEWSIKRLRARALLRVARGDHDRAVRDARRRRRPRRRSRAVVLAADAERTLAEVLRAAGRDGEASAAAGSALALDEAKGNLAAAAATRERFAALAPTT